MIHYVEKKFLYPAFGAAYQDLGVAYIRKDLPGPVLAFVVCHEKYHLQDEARWWVWREIKANVAGAWKHPWGFLWCVWMSVSSLDRLKFYLGRIRKGA